MNAINNLLKTTLYFFFDNCTIFLARILKKKELKRNRILIFRFDAIGDYIIFRNFLEQLRKSELFASFEMEFWGNLQWKDLFLQFDAGFVNEYYLLDTGKFADNLPYRLKWIWKSAGKKVSLLINPVYSRKYYLEILSKAINAEQKISFKGDYTSITKFQELITRNYYTEKLNIQHCLHDFSKTAFLYTYLTQEVYKLDSPVIEIEKNRQEDFFKLHQILPGFVLLFPGSREPQKRWPGTNFLSVCRYLINTYQYNVIIAGDKNDKQVAEFIEAGLTVIEKSYFFDFTSKTTLTELLYLIAGSRLLVTNDSCSVHMAVALDKKAIGIFNGQHFGRFAPYTADLKKAGDNDRQLKRVYLYPFEVNMGNLLFYASKYKHKTDHLIKEIKIEDINYYIEQLIKN